MQACKLLVIGLPQRTREFLHWSIAHSHRTRAHPNAVLSRREARAVHPKIKTTHDEPRAASLAQRRPASKRRFRVSDCESVVVRRLERATARACEAMGTAQRHRLCPIAARGSRSLPFVQNTCSGPARAPVPAPFASRSHSHRPLSHCSLALPH